MFRQVCLIVKFWKEENVRRPQIEQKQCPCHRRDNYEKRPVLSATIHPDLKRTLVAMSERTGMTVSQVTDEVLYKGLVGMQEMDELE